MYPCPAASRPRENVVVVPVLHGGKARVRPRDDSQTREEPDAERSERVAAALHGHHQPSERIAAITSDSGRPTTVV